MRLLRFLLLGIVIGGLAACAGVGGGPPVVSIGDAGHNASYTAGSRHF
jgi:hypothetical protein